jgi:hypothetical protein
MSIVGAASFFGPTRITVRAMKKARLLLVAAVLVTGASTAFADKEDNRGDRDHRGMPSAAASALAHAAPSSAVAAAASGAAAATPPGAAKSDDEGGSDDEKPEQREKRHGYVATMGNKIAAAVRANGKGVTEDERDVIKDHWRRAMRLWRIRHLALLDNDKASVARVDAILARLDKQTENKLKELNGKAPAAGAAAASAAPSAAPAGSAKKEGEK